MAEAGRRTVSRRDLSRHERFEAISPEVGVLDDDAFAEAYEEDPDEALALLAETAGATDQALRSVARQLAARVMIGVARSGTARHGVGRLRTRPLHASEGDLDLDRSMDAILAGAATRPTDADGLHVSAWERHDTAVCLLIDRSGSMAGDRLAAAAVAAAAITYRTPRDCSVVCFSDDAVVVTSQEEVRDAEEVVTDVLSLRGFGITDIGLALRTAARQLHRSRAGRRVAVLLSDCRATTGGDPFPHVAGIDELVILAPADDTADAEAFADSLGARWAPLAGPSAVPEAIRQILSD